MNGQNENGFIIFLWLICFIIAFSVFILSLIPRKNEPNTKSPADDPIKTEQPPKQEEPPPPQESVDDGDGVTLLYKLMECFYRFGPARRWKIARHAYFASRTILANANKQAYVNPDKTAISEHIEFLGDYLANQAYELGITEQDRYAIVKGLRKAIQKENLPIQLREVIIAGLTPRIMAAKPAS